MSNINFVPDDYVQSNESRRANLMCLVLFSVVMAALGGSFVTIKIRQRACSVEESLVNAKMARMQESIKKFEELQTKRKEMMRTALTTAELLESVPRSVVLASLTNNLPAGVSLLKVGMLQKEITRTASQASAARSKYQAAQEQQAGSDPEAKAPEKQVETDLDIEGVSPSDLQVAAYIERLSGSILMTNVALVESREKKVDDTSFRQFKLTAMLRPEIHLTKEDVEEIKAKAAHSVYQF
jgi:Tfp pilus assembly protein PilN